MLRFLTIGFPLLCAGLVLLYFVFPDTVRSAFGSDPDKLGWLDDAEFTAQDRARVSALTGQTYGTQQSWIGAMQSGVRSGITRRDMELMRQDRRRAQAAYPDVSADELLTPAWFNADESDKIPSKWGGGNSNSTQGRDGQWYLDGGFYASYVKPKYSLRASAAETKAFFAAKKLKDDQKRIASLREGGVFWSGGSSGGWNESVSCNPKTGTCVGEWGFAPNTKRYTFPFVPEEWIGVHGAKAVEALPSFAKATVEEIHNARPTVTMGYSTASSGRPFNGTLMPGESVSVTVPLAGFNKRD